MILSASGIKKEQIKPEKTALVYLLIALFCVLFGAVYEYFSHDVYSWYMMYAFVFPLAGGVLPFLLLSVCPQCKRPGRLARNLYHSGIAAFTVGSIVQGVLEIYGTTNVLADLYWYAGGAFVAAAVLAVIADSSSRH